MIETHPTAEPQRSRRPHGRRVCPCQRRLGYSENFDQILFRVAPGRIVDQADGRITRVTPPPPVLANRLSLLYVAVPCGRNQGANTLVLWCNIARLWGQLTKSQHRAKNECVDQVSLSSMTPRGPSLVHCLIFKSARTGNSSTLFRALPLSAGRKFLMRRIVMPPLLQNRSKRAYRTVPKPGPEMRVALEE
jgi:hypothetical protein